MSEQLEQAIVIAILVIAFAIADKLTNKNEG